MTLVLDFDGTITAQDTINVLAQSAIKIHRERGHDFSPAWDEIVDVYVKSHAEHKASYPVAEGIRLDREAESKFLGSMRDVEVASAERVEAAGIFDGISPQDLVAAGTAAVREGSVVLRDGLAELLSLAESRGWPVYVLSVNWSKSFIRGVLYQFDDRLTVVSNEIHDGGRIFSPDTQTFLATAGDKLGALRGILRDAADGPVVYFGDSTTDIECLLLFSGIVISSSGDSSLLRTLSRVRGAVPHVEDGADADRLLWARDFTEVFQARTLSSPALLDASQSQTAHGP
ncbi:haloacid dehalogenase-like hydrolase [Candidatus Bathyarchaeota archaeon]|nr:haloacid dehalogenase-like hydrolase [Candidatus Bathyarchaeota archaeon]